MANEHISAIIACLFSRVMVLYCRAEVGALINCVCVFALEMGLGVS